MPRESDDEVLTNIPPHLHPLFRRIGRTLRAKRGQSRTEAFLSYVHDHPGEEDEAVDRVVEWKLKQHLRPMLDFYETPTWAVRAVLPLLPVVEGKTRILDPGCGSGVILRELGAQYPENEVVGLEKDSARYEACAASTDLDVRRGDFLTFEEKFDLVVSNPPYSHAMEFVQQALRVAPVVAMLLRLGFLAGQRRAAWHREHPCHVAVLPRRPSFTADGKTDATEYAWFIWGTENAGRHCVLDVEGRR